VSENKWVVGYVTHGEERPPVGTQLEFGGQRVIADGKTIFGGRWFVVRDATTADNQSPKDGAA